MSDDDGTFDKFGEQLLGIQVVHNDRAFRCRLT